MTVKGCPDGHSNFSGEGEWEEDDTSVEEEKNRQGKREGRQRQRLRGRELPRREKWRRKRLIKTEREWDWWTEPQEPR